MTTIARTPWIDDDGSGRSGTIINNAEKQTIYNQVDGALAALDATDAGHGTAIAGLDSRVAALQLQGTWNGVPFDVADFWPGVTAAQVAVNAFAVVGNTVLWILSLQGAPGPPTASPFLYFRAPAIARGRVAACQSPLAHAYDGAPTGGYLTVGNVDAIAAVKDGAANWTGAGPVYVQFTALVALSA